MHRWKEVVSGVWFASVFVLALVTVTAHTDSRPRDNRGWWVAQGKLNVPMRPQARQSPTLAAQSFMPDHELSRSHFLRDFLKGQRLFERQKFGGNGRTCLTCHSRETGTVSPADAQARFRRTKHDPLFIHDGSDDDDPEL